MKKQIISTILMIVVILSAAGVSGCLENESSENTSLENESPENTNVEWGENISEFYPTDLYVRETDGNRTLELRLRERIYVDESNITVSMSSDVINVNLPIAEGNNGSYIEWFPLDISNLTLETGKMYTVLVNGDEEVRSGFILNDNETTTFIPASIHGMKITSDKTTASVVIFGYTGDLSAYSLPGEEITEDTDGKTYKIYFPVKRVYDGGSINASAHSYQKTIPIASLNELEDGTYKVRVNGIELMFTVKNHKISNTSSYGNFTQ
ncbi:hypothetical protein MsAg5_14720 [Methanosarcinaceae archaeon Ag5]|uniref:Uncharacterized protein n=1 Tax=Methanolapillus africanus TaxID=3028297 RepID=A0AAE4MKZ5_9EURY|nr:hypothetical protein [Methanosarcinaceae archaeon Ag5]